MLHKAFSDCADAPHKIYMLLDSIVGSATLSQQTLQSAMPFGYCGVHTFISGVGLQYAMPLSSMEYIVQLDSKCLPSLPSSASLLMATFAFSMVQIATDSPLNDRSAY